MVHNFTGTFSEQRATNIRAEIERKRKNALREADEYKRLAESSERTAETLLFLLKQWDDLPETQRTLLDTLWQTL